MSCCGYGVPLFFGCLFFFGSIGFDFLISFGIQQELGRRLVLKNDTEFYQNWLDPQVSMFTTFHLFHVKNADAFLKGKEDAQLEQVGPFTFKKRFKRKIYGFSPDESEIMFRTSVYFHYVPQMSNQAVMDQNITILNLPLAAMLGAAIGTATPLGRMFLANTLANTVKKMDQKLLITLTPREFLIDGYNIPIIASFKALGGVASEDEDPDGKFSLMSKRNASNRGLWTSYTGVDDMAKTGRVKTWNNLTHFTCWSGNTCNEVKGAEGAFFAPPITHETVLTVFSPELNGSMTGYFSEERHSGGLLKYRFKIMEAALEAPNNNPDNECKCVKSETEKNEFCSIDGILDVSACQRGAPVVLSKPHFFLGSPVLRNRLKGLEPVKEIHESYFDVDPFLGVVTRAVVRMQTNVNLKLLKILSIYKKVPSVIFPVFMSEDSVIVDGQFLEPVAYFQDIKYNINLTLKIAMILGAVFISIAILIWFKTRRNRIAKKLKAKALAMEEEALQVTFPLCMIPEKIELNGNVYNDKESTTNGFHDTNHRNGELIIDNNNDTNSQ